MSIASSSSTLSPIERVLSQSLELADYRDVHLYAFTRRTVFPDGTTWIDLPQPIAATSSLLKRVEYFRKRMFGQESLFGAFTDQLNSAYLGVR